MSLECGESLPNLVISTVPCGNIYQNVIMVLYEKHLILFNLQQLSDHFLGHFLVLL